MYVARRRKGKEGGGQGMQGKRGQEEKEQSAAGVDEEKRRGKEARGMW